MVIVDYKQQTGEAFEEYLEENPNGAMEMIAANSERVLSKEKHSWVFGDQPDAPIFVHNLPSGRLFVDFNPQLYPSRVERIGWTMGDYQKYIGQITELLSESLDQRVIASKIIFQQDYESLMAESQTKK